jgi:2-phosphosulfolactate phosphatase
VDVTLTWRDLRPADVADRVVIVIDVLRATSTIVTAMIAGAAEVRPASSPAEARVRLACLGLARGNRAGLLMGGEREGRRIRGFDLSNSPLEYTPSAVREQIIFFTTTNGTRTLQRAAGRPKTAGGAARRVLVAAFLNAPAVVERASALGGSVVVACAGTKGKVALEDLLLAGLLVDGLEQRARLFGTGRGTPRFAFRDLARASAAIYRSLAGPQGENLTAALRATDHARYLTDLGFGDDVAYCARRDVTAIVPEFVGGRVLLPGAAAGDRV